MKQHIFLTMVLLVVLASGPVYALPGGLDLEGSFLGETPVWNGYERKVEIGGPPSRGPGFSIALFGVLTPHLYLGVNYSYATLRNNYHVDDYNPVYWDYKSAIVQPQIRYFPLGSTDLEMQPFFQSGVTWHHLGWHEHHYTVSDLVPADHDDRVRTPASTTQGGATLGAGFRFPYSLNFYVVTAIEYEVTYANQKGRRDYWRVSMGWGF